MNKKKKIPALRFPKFQNSGEWEDIKLGDCLSYLQPTPYLVESTNYSEDKGVPVLTAGKSFVLGYTDEEKGIFRDKLPVIIFDDFTTASQFVNFPFKVKSSAIKILLAQKKYDIKFVFESMQILRYEVGVHKRHWISVYSKKQIAIPSLPEQQKIADCLSSLDDLIDNHSEKLALLEKHKKGLMQKLFPREGQKVPELRFPEFQNDGEWEEKEISELGKTFNGLSGKKSIDFGKGKPYIQYKQVFDKSYIDFSECGKVRIGEKEKQNKTEYGDILFTTSSETPEEVGFSSVIVNLPIEDTYLNSFCFILRPFDIDELKPEFSRYLFRSPIYRKLVSEIAQGSTRYNLSKVAFLKLILPKPLSQEQQKIADCLSSLDNLITAERENIEQLKQHKKGLMQGLFVN